MGANRKCSTCICYSNLD